MNDFNRNWIIENALDEIKNYEKGILTIRGLHYRLVSRGMTNNMNHYKRVVAAMIKARWSGLVDFDAFSDHDREITGKTKYEQTSVEESVEEAKKQIFLWMNNFNKNRWENQPYYVEVWIEKKALQGVFQPVCRTHYVAFGACKGYPSLTFLNEAKERFISASLLGKKPLILYFGDYDPSGEDIPRSITNNIQDLGCDSIELRRISLLQEQVLKWGLPPVPAKKEDSRTKHWKGLGQVELDAVEPNKLRRLCNKAIQSVFDENLYQKLELQEQKERRQYRIHLRNYISDNFINE